MGTVERALAMNARDRLRSATQTGLPGYFAQLAGVEQVSWGDVDADCIRAAVARASSLSYALTLGRTSDGGALSISILTGAAPVKLYAPSPAACEDILTRIAALESHE